MLDKCTIWKGAKNEAGYGITWCNNRWAYAHRAAVSAKPGEVVRHVCDNPSCVNPNHLVKGTHKENSQDMVSKNRQVKGEKSHLAKLNETSVKAIRSCNGSMSSQTCANIFNISKTNVLDIWKNKIWKHVQ